MLPTLLATMIAFNAPSDTANDQQHPENLFQAGNFTETSVYLTQIPLESQELVKKLYNYVRNEGMKAICQDMQLEEINFPSVLDLENAPLGSLLFLGASEMDIESVVYCLSNGQCLQISSQDEDAELDISSLSNIDLSIFPYQALYKTSNSISVDPSGTQEEESYAADSPSYLEENFDSYYINEECLPYVLSPKTSDITLASFKSWAENHQPELRSLIATQGAVLLRGFPVEGALDFAEIVQTVIGKNLIDYKGEGSRKRIAQGVYTSTEAPQDFKIPLHNELSCTNNPIDYICFYCEVAPEPGTGQTLLGRTEDVTLEIMNRPELWNMFDGKVIKYISRHPPEGSFFTSVNPSHKSWPDAFETTDPNEVEKICKEKEYDFEWQGDWVKVTRHVPATRGPDSYFDHPYWFNQAYLYHANPRIRGGWVNHLLANLVYIVPSTRQYDIEFEDGTPIPQEAIYEIYDVLDAKTIKFNWEKNDVLLLDNRRTLHGKAPCYGERRILTSMIQ